MYSWCMWYKYSQEPLKKIRTDLYLKFNALILKVFSLFLPEAAAEFRVSRDLGHAQ